MQLHIYINIVTSDQLQKNWFIPKTTMIFNKIREESSFKGVELHFNVAS